MQSITITLNNSDSGHDEEKAHRKTVDAIDDLLSELCVQKINKEAALAAYLTVGQGLVSMIRADAKEILVGEDVGLYVEEFIRKCNERHVEKMRQPTSKG